MSKTQITVQGRTINLNHDKTIGPHMHAVDFALRSMQGAVKSIEQHPDYKENRVGNAQLVAVKDTMTKADLDKKLTTKGFKKGDVDYQGQHYKHKDHQNTDFVFVTKEDAKTGGQLVVRTDLKEE